MRIKKTVFFGILSVSVCGAGTTATASVGDGARLATDTGNDDARFSQQLTPAQKLELENKKVRALASFAKALNLLEAQYVDSEVINPDALLQKAIMAMAADLDPHTSYLTPEQYTNFVSNNPNEKNKTPKVSLFDLSHNVAYIKLPQFNRSSFQDMMTNINIFKAKHNGTLSGLVFDLRDNSGGLFDQAVKISNLFIDSGILVSTVGRDSNAPQKVEYAQKTNTVENFPIVVLVNEATASASEIVAGALQDRERAIVMGSTTYGKGSVQKLVPLPNGGALKFTVARYYTPSGRSIQAEGIVPDIPFIPRREADLKQHLTNKELTVPVPKNAIEQDVNSWHTFVRNDPLVKNAYLYLRRANFY